MTDATTVNSALATLGASGWVVNDVFGGELASGQIVLIGDSITNRNINGTAISDFYSVDGYWAWAQILLQGQLFCTADLGVSGENSTQIWRRFGSVFSYPSKWVGILAGSNDVVGGVPAATIINNLRSMYRAAASRGRMVVAMTIMPRLDCNTGAERDVLSRVNQWIKDYCLQNSNIVCADLYAAWADPATGNAASGLSDDGIHPNAIGAAALGRAIYQALSPYFPSVSPFLQGVNLDPYNLAYNGMANGNNASGTNGYVNAAGFTGTGPDGWTNIRTGTSTGVCSKVTSSDWRQRTGARCAATIAAVSEEVGFNIRIDVSTWAAASARTQGQSYAQPTVDNGYWYVADVGGTTGGSEPVWPTQLGDTVADNTVTWRCVQKINPGDVIYGQAEIAGSSLVGSGIIDLSLQLMDNAFANLWSCNSLQKAGYLAFPSFMPATAVHRTLQITVPSNFTIAISGPTIRLSLRPKFIGAAGATCNMDVFSAEIKKVVSVS